MTYAEFKNRWSGQRVDWDKVFSFQCVDLVLQYISECYGINGAYGNAVNWWTNPDQKLYAKFDRIATTDCKQGDIVVLRTNGRPAGDFSGDGHIGIADSQDAGSVWLLEQNAVGSGTGTGRDAIGVYRAIAKSRIAGVLRPKPVQVTPTAPLWTVDGIAPKLIQVKPGSRKWNLGHGTFNDIVNNPITTSDSNTVFTAVAVLHHRDIPQYNYYLEDANTPHGWNVLDCLDRMPEPPKPFIIDFIPAVSTPVDKYELLVTLPYYSSYNDANMDVNAKGVLPLGGIHLPKEMTVWERRNDYINLTDNNQINRDWWVNTRKNKLPVVPEMPVVATLPAIPERITEAVKDAAAQIPAPLPVTNNAKFTPDEFIPVNENWRLTTNIRPDPVTLKQTVVLYRAMNTMPIEVYDYEDKQAPFVMRPFNDQISVAVVQTFNVENSSGLYTVVGRAKQIADKHWFYGVDMRFLEQLPDEQQPWYRQQSAVTKPLDLNRDGRLDMSDVVAMGQDFLDWSKTTVHKLGAWDKSVHMTEKTKHFGRGVVDGFKKRKAK